MGVTLRVHFMKCNYVEICKVESNNAPSLDPFIVCHVNEVERDINDIHTYLYIFNTLRVNPFPSTVLARF
jgi:hypothetical protein